MPETQNSRPDQQEIPEKGIDTVSEKAKPEKQNRAQIEPKKEFGMRQKLQTVSYAMTALSFVPSERREQIMNGLLERAGIPSGPYEYTLELRNLLVNDSKALEEDINRYQKANTKEKRQELLQTILDHTETFVENLIQKFVLDNTPKEQRKEREKVYQTKRIERIRDTYKIDLLATQMKICLAFVQGDEALALTHAKQYVAEKYLGLKSLVKVDERTQQIIRSLAKNLMTQTEKNILPVLEKKVREFAKQSFTRSFWNRAKQTGNFAWDWVRTPFNDEAKQRMAQSITPIVRMNKLQPKKQEGYMQGAITGLKEVNPSNAFAKTAPIMCDFAKTAFQVGMNHKEALILLASVAGAVSFDLALMAATWGVGAAIKGTQVAGTAVQTSGTVVKAFSAATAGFSIGKTALRPLHGLSEKLSFANLEEKVHTKVIDDARKEG